MEFRRAVRVLSIRRRWIVVAAIVGALVALGVAAFVNSRIVPEFEARATVDYLRPDSENQGAFEARLADARSVAMGLLDDPAQQVTVEEGTGRLVFSMTGEDPALLESDVARLRSEFVSVQDAEQRFEEATRAELDRLQSEIEAVRSQLAAMQPQAPSVDPSLTAQREQLAFEINSLRQRIATLRIDLAFPELAPTADPESLRAELERSQDLLERLTVALAELPSATTPDTTAPGLDALVLQRHLQDLEARYVSFALDLLEQPDVVGPLAPAFTIDQTRDEFGRVTAALAGLVLGMLSLAAILLVRDRLRPLVLDVVDVESMGLEAVSVDRSRPGGDGDPWYPRARQSQRRRDVQGVRAMIDDSVTQGPASIGVVGVSTTSEDVHALTADVSASVAASGVAVLLVDARFADPSALPEYGDREPDLADLVSDEWSFRANQIKDTLAERPEVLTDLSALRAGTLSEDPADALSGGNFRSLLAASADLDHRLFVASPEWGEPETDVLAQRLDSLLLVCRARRTKRHELSDAVLELGSRHATLVGVVVLHGRSQRERRRLSRLLRARATGRHRRRLDRDLVGPDDADVIPEAGPGPEAASDHPAPSGGAGGFEAGTSDSIGSDPAWERQASEGRLLVEPPSFETEVVIDHRRPDAATLRAAERLLARRVVDLLDGHFFDREEPAPGDVLFITPRPPELAPGTVLARLLVDDLEGNDELERSLPEVLGGNVNARRLQAWVERRFFEVHSDIMAGRPVVWHLSSEAGTFQALVRAEAFDSDLVDILCREVARLTRPEKAAQSPRPEGHADQAAMAADLRAFEERLLEIGDRGWARPRGPVEEVARLAVLVRHGVVRNPSSS